MLVLLSGTSGTAPLWPVYALARDIVMPVLYQLSGATLQPGLFWPLLGELGTCTKLFRWTLPDGSVVSELHPVLPTRALVDIRDSGERPLQPSDWEHMQDMLCGNGFNVPLWRTVLADAHRARGHDLRQLVLYCATALDVGV